MGAGALRGSPHGRSHNQPRRDASPSPLTRLNESRFDPTGFLEGERRALGERWYRQEYLCSFEDCVAALFAYEDLLAAC